MSDLTDIDAIASFVYAQGRDPIDWAIWLAECQINARDTIVAARQWKPDAYPIFLGSLDTPSVARRIIGNLLDAGWTPPTIDKPEVETP